MGVGVGLGLGAGGTHPGVCSAEAADAADANAHCGVEWAGRCGKKEREGGRDTGGAIHRSSNGVEPGPPAGFSPPYMEIRPPRWVDIFFPPWEWEWGVVQCRAFCFTTATTCQYRYFAFAGHRINPPQFCGFWFLFSIFWIVDSGFWGLDSGFWILGSAS